MKLWSAQWRPVIDGRGFFVVFSTHWHGCLLQVQDLLDSTTPLADTAPHARHRPLCVTWPDQQGHVWRFRAGFNWWTQPSLTVTRDTQLVWTSDPKHASRLSELLMAQDWPADAC